MLWLGFLEPQATPDPPPDVIDAYQLSDSQKEQALYDYKIGLVRRDQFIKRLKDLRREIAGTLCDLRERMNDRRGDLMRLVGDLVFDDTYHRVSDSGSLLAELGRLVSHDQDIEAEFLAAIRKSPHVGMQRYAEAREKLDLNLRQKPAELQLQTLEGSIVSLGGLRGKVVLVYYWNIYCSSCMETLPKLQAVYDRYRTQGFEVLGICKIYPQDREKLPRLLGAKGITWPNAVIGSEEVEEQLVDFGVGQGGGAPFLLDQAGKLVSTDISGQWLEYEIRVLLGLHLLEPGQEAWPVKQVAGVP